MRKVIVFVSGLLALSLFGCTSAQKSRPIAGRTAYQRALHQAFDELNEKQVSGRIIASMPEEYANNFAGLRNAQQVLIFPRQSNASSKMRAPYRQQFLGPIQYQITAQRLVPCEHLLKENSSQWNAVEYFQDDVLPSQNCAILRMVPNNSGMKKRSGQVSELRLYLNSNYQGFGADAFVFNAKVRQSELRKVRLDPNDPVSFAFLNFPIDLPNLSSTQQNVSISDGFEFPEDDSLLKRLSKFTFAKCDSPVKIEYKDAFESNHIAFWCKGSAWPNVIINQKYVAVLR